MINLKVKTKNTSSYPRLLFCFPCRIIYYWFSVYPRSKTVIKSIQKVQYYISLVQKLYIWLQFHIPYSHCSLYPKYVIAMIRKLDPKIKNHNRLKGPEEATLFQGKQQYELDVALYRVTLPLPIFLVFSFFQNMMELKKQHTLTFSREAV